MGVASNRTRDAKEPEHARAGAEVVLQARADGHGRSAGDQQSAVPGHTDAVPKVEGCPESDPALEVP
jgi:hypothetical protein